MPLKAGRDEKRIKHVSTALRMVWLNCYLYIYEEPPKVEVDEGERKWKIIDLK